MKQALTAQKPQIQLMACMPAPRFLYEVASPVEKERMLRMQGRSAKSAERPQNMKSKIPF